MTLTLIDIRDNEGARVCKKRVGRGIGSGLGKTCGRGGKGQTARTGVAINGFEGGQTPIYRRLPKRGFNNIHQIPFYELTLWNLEKIAAKHKVDLINRDFLIEKGYMKQWQKAVSLIGSCEFKAKVSLEVTRASKNAQKAIESAGGKLVIA